MNTFPDIVLEVASAVIRKRALGLIYLWTAPDKFFKGLRAIAHKYDLNMKRYPDLEEANKTKGFEYIMAERAKSIKMEEK